jgi:hypothetical protein
MQREHARQILAMHEALRAERDRARSHAAAAVREPTPPTIPEPPVSRAPSHAAAASREPTPPTAPMPAASRTSTASRDASVASAASTIAYPASHSHRSRSPLLPTYEDAAAMPDDPLRATKKRDRKKHK